MVDLLLMVLKRLQEEEEEVLFLVQLRIQMSLDV
jgi:hypothetical protein